MEIRTVTKGQPLAKIVTRKEFHCPSCKFLLSKDDLAHKSIKCPACGTSLELPNICTDNVEATNERRDKRCPVSLKVKYNTANEFKVDYTKNVSHGGMFIRTESLIETGTKMQLELYLPDLNVPILLSVEVVHSEMYSNGKKNSGVGVRFIDIDQLSKSILINYLSALSDCA
jgi:type IV pilus assembly protein PilZ